MTYAATHPKEADRLEALYACGLVGTEAEIGYDDAVKLASTLCNSPIALMTLVDECGLWFKAKVGIDLDEAPLDVSPCAIAVANETTLVVEDARKDPRFAGSAMVTGPLGVVHYAGAVFYSPMGFPLGTVCVLGPEPRTLSVAQIEGLEALARQIGTQIAARLDCFRLEQYALEISEARLHLELQATALQDANERLAILASTDGLTGIANRRFLTQWLDTELSRCTEDRPMAVVMMDIDEFKSYNDTFGHTEGDVVLRRVAELVGACLRPGDMVARYGGEEFCAVLAGCTPETGLLVAERIRTTIENSLWPRRRVTVSLGVASTSEPCDANSIIRDADTALYASKRGGRNRTTVATPVAAQPALAQR